MRVIGATSYPTEVPTPFPRVSVSPKTRIIMHVERSVFKQGGVSVSATVCVCLAHDLNVFDVIRGTYRPHSFCGVGNVA